MIPFKKWLVIREAVGHEDFGDEPGEGSVPGEDSYNYFQHGIGQEEDEDLEQEDRGEIQESLIRAGVPKAWILHHWQKIEKEAINDIYHNNMQIEQFIKKMLNLYRQSI